VVLLPLGVALVLAGLLTGLNSIGAWRWGGVLDDNQTCDTGQQGMCLVREDVTIDGPDYTWRNAGDDWDLQPATGRAHEVSLPGGDSDDLEDAQVRQGVMLSQPDGDVVGVEVDGRTIGTTWVGAYGTLQLLGLGLLVTSLGAGLILGARRMRRATGSWVEHEPLQRHGSAALALPVLVGFVLWVLPRFLW